MWKKGWREKIWSSLDQHFDLIIIGGGITGGGVFMEATRAGLKAILIEAGDFSSGTSSRSSKLVHGGFRYLKNGQIKMTYDSVKERERLVTEGRGLITQIGFIIASFKGDRIPTWALGLGLTIYDLIALKWGHQYYPAQRLLELCPQLNTENLIGGYRYFDAITDDSRLVLRVIQSGVINGGVALNYAQVNNILVSKSGKVVGVQIQDVASPEINRSAEIRATSVINATGAWADDIRKMATPSKNKGPKIKTIRKLRGSHLIISEKLLSLTRSINIWHPRDKRPIFFFPWEGVTLVGTTDIDHGENLDTEPTISSDEVDYLLEGLNFVFPSLGIGMNDVQASFSGIRAVINTGKSDPSKESREHILWYENGLLTLSGGKLTTFRLMAHEALNLLKKKNPSLQMVKPDDRVFNVPHIDQSKFPDRSGLVGLRLRGRFGEEIHSFMETSRNGELTNIESTSNLWAEVRWAVQEEGVIHLDDLLLRRLRLGLTLPNGGLSIMDRIKSIIQEELDWTDEHWVAELKRYQFLINNSYSINFLETQ
jgi:glycerol-3-phosphate dehydrogenase